MKTKLFCYFMGALMIIAPACFCWGYYKGKINTMKSFQLEECWVDKPSMDINCTTYIGDL